MYAKLPAESVMNGRNYAGDKETVAASTVVAYRKGEFIRAIRAVWYVGQSRTASTVYCSIWCHAPDGRGFAGHGYAGGYGYHKGSAALESAIRSAGISLYGDVYGYDKRSRKLAYIGGVGETAERAALQAIARAMGYTRFTIV